MSSTGDNLEPPDANPSLRELFGIDGGPSRIPEAEWGQILRLQLDAPLLADLSASGLAPVTAYPTAIKSFRDAILSAAASLELLVLVKDFAKQQRRTGLLPPSVAGVLYYLAIAAGLVRHGVLISRVANSSIRDGLNRIDSSGWVDEEMLSLAREARALLSAS